MLRSDPDSRARMRITPEMLLHMPRHHCVASWIIGGQRAPAFTGQTYPIPTGGGWFRDHYQRLVDLCGNYPEDMTRTYERQITVSSEQALGQRARNGDGPGGDNDRAMPHTAEPDGPDVFEPSTEPTSTTPPPPEPAPTDGVLEGAVLAPRHDDAPLDVEQPATVDSGPDIYVPAPEDVGSEALHSRVLDLVGRTIGPRDYPVPDLDEIHDAADTPPGYAELAVIDQIVKVAEPRRPATTKPLTRKSDTHYRVIKLLDRCGTMTTAQLQRAVWPADPAQVESSNRAARKVLATMEAAGLIQAQPTTLHQVGGHPPLLWSLTPRGFRLGQEPTGGRAPVIPERRKYRASETQLGFRGHHDLHAINWLQALHDTVPRWVTDNWRTLRYHTARFSPPRVRTHGGRLRPMIASDILLGPGYTFTGMPLDGWEDLVCDLAIELHVRSEPAPRPGRVYDLRFDLLVELQRRRKPADTIPKLLKYDAFLTGWCLAHQRIQRLRTRPICLIVGPNPKWLLSTMAHADEHMTAAIARVGRPPSEWYYAGRDHILFCLEHEIHFGSLRALKLPPLPANLRLEQGDESPMAVTQVGILPPSLIRTSQ